MHLLNTLTVPTFEKQQSLQLCFQFMVDDNITKKLNL
jgi:hypothetical protein